MIGSGVETRLGADLRRRLIAVHLRHLQVHQHDVEWRRPRTRQQPLDRFRPLFATVDRRARAFQQLDRDLLVDLVVLDQQDPRTRSRSAVSWLVRRAATRRPARLARAKSVHERVDQHRPGHRLDQEAVELSIRSASSRTSSRPNAVTMIDRRRMRQRRRRS